MRAETATASPARTASPSSSPAPARPRATSSSLYVPLSASLAPIAPTTHAHARTQDLNANVAAGHAVNNPAVLTPFPTGSAKGDQQARIATLLSTLQNLHGPGVGCPAVSTVYGQLQQQINALPN